jgi:hypothetical protein
MADKKKGDKDHKEQSDKKNVKFADVRPGDGDKYRSERHYHDGYRPTSYIPGRGSSYEAVPNYPLYDRLRSRFDTHYRRNFLLQLYLTIYYTNYYSLLSINM